MSATTFLKVFDETPAQAIKAFRQKPEVFGTLRGYLGPKTLARYKARVTKLAKLLLDIETSKTDAKS
ncbi:MAG: hypothetical protein JSR99_12300 [Proteobacteria bacterium]|nr:hypothetical protein [Pseudomonadota bacterium]